MKEWPEVIIYQNDISPHCRTVLMVIKELGLNVTFREVNLAKKEHLSEEFLKMNPLHTIPVMEERGYVLTDSHAIACFIIDDLSDFDYSLYPKDLQVRALVNQYLMIEAATLFPLVKHTIVSNSLFVYTPRRVGKFICCMSDFSHLIVILSNCVIGLRFSHRWEIRCTCKTMVIANTCIVKHPKASFPDSLSPRLV